MSSPSLLTHRVHPYWYPYLFGSVFMSVSATGNCGNLPQKWPSRFSDFVYTTEICRKIGHRQKIQFAIIPLGCLCQPKKNLGSTRIRFSVAHISFSEVGQVLWKEKQKNTKMVRKHGRKNCHLSNKLPLIINFLI